MMLFLFLALWPTTASANAAGDRLACATALAKVNAWIVPFAGHQNVYQKAVSADGNAAFFWSSQETNKIYLFTPTGLRVVHAPREKIRTNFSNPVTYRVVDLPDPVRFRYNLNDTTRTIHALEDSASAQALMSREPSPAEMLEAEERFREAMGYLWSLRENIRRPGWASQFSNAVNRNRRPSSILLGEAERLCAPYFQGREAAITAIERCP